MNNPNITRMSTLYAPTLKEDPTDAEIASHKLLLRAGFIRKTAAGIYAFLPLGKRVLAKIENIVREEMDACGAQEIRMPMLQPEELWQESGRADAYGPERMRLNDRHDHEFCLGPTHEELITALVRAELRSYKQLPLNMYQIATKFRDEIRPRFGLLRSREFVMKDAYSFHDTQESLQEEYDKIYDAYGRICERCGLEYRPVQADAGQIGGAVTCEFHALADAGESALVYCDCGYAASDEVGEGLARPTVYDVPEMKKVATPGVHTIAELAELLGIPETSTVKALSGKNDEGKLVVLFVPGDHEVNEEKAARVAGGFTLLTDEDMDLFARRGVTAVHCPNSNLKLASGIAPVRKMMDRGMNVALGTDGVSSSNNTDLFEAVKLAALLSNGSTLDPTSLTAQEALKLATVNGAKAQGRENECGVIAPGMDADLIMLDFAQPHLIPCHNPISNLVYAASGHDVRMTMVRGKILYEDGHYTTIDLDHVLREFHDYVIPLMFGNDGKEQPNG